MTLYEVTTYVEANSFTEALEDLLQAPSDFAFRVTDESNTSVIVDPTGDDSNPDDCHAAIWPGPTPEPGYIPTVTRT